MEHLDFHPQKNLWKQKQLLVGGWTTHLKNMLIGSSPQVGAGVKIIDVVIPKPIGSMGRSIVPWESVMGVINKLLDFFPNDGTCWFFVFKQIFGISLVKKQLLGFLSGDSWMYPYQRTPMGNPYISPIYPYIVGVYGLLSPRIPIQAL